ncbi:MAG: hypothetical protein AAB227_12040, partial [Pseudomonadota bacterium]
MKKAFVAATNGCTQDERMADAHVKNSPENCIRLIRTKPLNPAWRLEINPGPVRALSGEYGLSRGRMIAE